MSLFLLTCPPLVDTFRIGTHTLFKLSIYIFLFLNPFHLTVARLLPSLIGFPLAIASGLSIYTHGVPVLTPFWSGLSIYTHGVPVLTPFWSGLSIYTHGVPVLTPFWSGLSIYTYGIPVLTPLCSGLSIYTHGANFNFAPAFLFNFQPFLRMARTSILPLHFFW